MTLKEAIKALRWAVKQAEELLGAHTGGPQEQEYRERLAQARVALETLRSEQRKLSNLTIAANDLIDAVQDVQDWNGTRVGDALAVLESFLNTPTE